MIAPYNDPASERFASGCLIAFDPAVLSSTGLVPVAGDVISGLVSSYLIWEARQLGAPRWLIARMMANTFLDTTIGAIPVVGDAFDLLFRANMKNMALLRKHMEKRGLGRTAGSIIEGEVVRAR